MKKLFKGLALCMMLLVSVVGFAQNKTVTGKVLGEKGEAIANASVVAKGTAKGTKTNANGEFTLDVPANATTLVVSSVGFGAKQVGITGGALEISLASTSNKLDDVIVNVGYGTQKKSVVTGAISRVTSKDLEKVPSGNVAQALQGRVSGVSVAQSSGQPGSLSTVRIRGNTTFTGAGNNPLWVVDNVVVADGAIGYLNQSDIESIEVLKDAASAAIYGTRAASGVIVVTTKKGTQGKMSINYNGFYGTSSPEKVLKLLNATQYGAIMNEKSINDGGAVLYPNLSILGEGTDWQKTIFNTDARRVNHELSLSGGTDKSTFYLSLGALNQQGIVTPEISNYNRKTIRLNSTHKISKIFTFGQTLGFQHSVSKGLGNTNSEFGGPLSSAINLDPTTPIVELDPLKAAAYPASAFRDANGNPYGISTKPLQEMTNPLAYTQTRLGNSSWGNEFIGNAFLEANLMKGLKFKTTFGAKLSNWGDDGFTPVYYLNSITSTLQNSYSKNSNNVFDWNIENVLSYNRKIKNHDFTILLGQGAYNEGNGGGSNATHKNLPITNYRDASFSWNIAATDKTGGAYEFIEHHVSSLFTRLNYNYKEKYLFTGILRRDGSSRFGINNKYGVFPSASLGWIVNKENFWKQNSILNTLKVRAGYGVVGNDNYPDHRFLSLVTGGYNYYVGNLITIGSAPQTLDNPDLHWEQTAQTNFGFDARLFNKINLTVEYFKKRTTGILQQVPIPGYVGVSSRPWDNIADMNNSGTEFELGYKNQIGQVNFSANGNFSTLKNKVTFVGANLDFIADEAASFQQMGIVTRTQVGQAYNSFYGLQTAGIFQTVAEIGNYKNGSGGMIQPLAKPGDFKWTDLNGDGKIDGNDKTYLGNSIPKYTYGLTLNFDFKGFDLMTFMQGAGGNKIFKGLRRLIGETNYQTDVFSRWTGPGTSNTYPRLTTTDANGNYTQMSDFYLEKGDFLRLKVVQLGYNLPVGLVSKIRASKLRIYISAENLYTFTKYTGYTPEIGGGVYGIDKGVYPQARSYMAGVSVQF
ncbi:MAG: TonB-dependent receptor [Ferruginibacter sp.]|nr:TonB-dependent receptor [Ferruginibacter sp.]